MGVDVLALDGVFDLGLSAVLDAPKTANEMIEIGSRSVPRFDARGRCRIRERERPIEPRAVVDPRRQSRARGTPLRRRLRTGIREIRAQARDAERDA